MTERRLLRTVVDRCDARLSGRFLSKLSERLAAKGVYTEPPLDSKGLRGRDWIYFASGPFPPDELLFPKERDLLRFVSACIGTGVFRDLRPARFARNGGREFRLPDGRRIDLLCEEKSNTSKGALVAIELKQDHERGVIEQLTEYLDTLKAQFPERAVRGIIITGRESRVGTKVFKDFGGHTIDWYCYEVAFRRAGDAWASEARGGRSVIGDAHGDTLVADERAMRDFGSRSSRKPQEVPAIIARDGRRAARSRHGGRSHSDGMGRGRGGMSIGGASCANGTFRGRSRVMAVPACGPLTRAQA